MKYALYTEQDNGKSDLQILGDLDLSHFMIDFLIKDIKIEEEMVEDANLDEIINLFVDTLEEIADESPYNVVWVVNERNEEVLFYDING